MNPGTPAALKNTLFKPFSASRLKVVSRDVRYAVRKSSRLSLPSFCAAAYLLHICCSIMHNKICKLNLSHVTLSTVKKLLKGLKSSKSTSVDGLDNFAVKAGAEFIAKPLHHIVTLSIMQQRFPKLWKLTKLVPLHKKLSPLELRIIVLWLSSRPLARYWRRSFILNYMTISHIIKF